MTAMISFGLTCGVAETIGEPKSPFSLGCLILSDGRLEGLSVNRRVRDKCD